MQRRRGSMRNAGSRHAWLKEQDEALKSAIIEHGVKSWAIVSSNIADRTGKECRERWMHHLNPKLHTKRTEWTSADNQKLMAEHAKCGNRWSVLAKLFPGRNESAVKAHWQELCKSKGFKIKTEGVKIKSEGVKIKSEAPPRPSRKRPLHQIDVIVPPIATHVECDSDTSSPLTSLGCSTRLHGQRRSFFEELSQLSSQHVTKRPRGETERGHMGLEPDAFICAALDDICVSSSLLEQHSARIMDDDCTLMPPPPPADGFFGGEGMFSQSTRPARARYVSLDPSESESDDSDQSDDESSTVARDRKKRDEALNFGNVGWQYSCCSTTYCPADEHFLSPRSPVVLRSIPRAALKSKRFTNFSSDIRYQIDAQAIPPLRPLEESGRPRGAGGMDSTQPLRAISGNGDNAPHQKHVDAYVHKEQKIAFHRQILHNMFFGDACKVLATGL